VLTGLFHPRYPKSHLDILNLSLLGLQLVLFYVLPRPAAKVFFLFYFAFWRAAYDAGLGWVLTKQSKKKWMVREVQRLGWLDEKRNPAARGWIRAQLQGKMGKDYSFDVSNLLVPANALHLLIAHRSGTSIGIQHLVVVQTTCGRNSSQVSTIILSAFSD
jgi:hypothetical protein